MYLILLASLSGLVVFFLIDSKCEDRVQVCIAYGKDTCRHLLSLKFFCFNN